ncbi:uncharacterized protein [Nicotiana sylvestris]|uniref:uncharacterized protein n=1 Tax=Nicotiana sylvestris TaxID=4096 RepID=UPI00388C6A5A
MFRARNSYTDTQDGAQETIDTIMAQGRTKKASTQKRREKSTKGVQIPRVEREEGVEHDDPVPQDLVPPPTAAPAQATISPEEPDLQASKLRVKTSFSSSAIDSGAAFGPQQ